MDTEDRYNVSNYKMAPSFIWEASTPEEEAAEHRRWNHPWRRFRRWLSWTRYRLGCWIAGIEP